MRAAALAILFLVPAASAAQAGAFTIDHAIDMGAVGSPAISPDGRSVIFTRTELDWEENERDARLWIARVDGSDVRPFTSEEGDGAARWSPDGRWVAFTRDARSTEDGGPGGEGRQVWLIRTDGGEARQLTRHPTSVRRYDWTPDSRRLVFLAEDTVPKAVREEREAGDDAVFVNEGPNGQTRGAYTNLWWAPIDFDDAEARPITAGERLIGDFAIAPGSDRIAFTYRTENHRNDAHRSEIAVVSLEGAEVRTLTSNEAPESALQWTPDGRSLLFTAPSLETWELDQGNLYLLAIADGATRQILPASTLDFRDAAFTPDGRYLDLVAQARTVSSFYRVDLRNGRVHQLSEWDGLVGYPSWSRDHERVAFTHQTPTSPAEVYSAPLQDGMRRTAITDVHADIRALDLATPENVTWRSEDGTEIEGLLYRPAGHHRAGAFVLEIHGGPAGVFARSFDADAQILAAHGYAILQPNVRGSTAYGDELLRGNMNDIGGGDYADLMTGVDAMIQRGVAHPDSLAVKGWSYGGILGGWTLTRTDRFRAASLGAMVSDWTSEFGVGFNYDVSRWYLGGDPWTNADLWRERSAYTHADRVTTPTILFHGDDDATDTMGQSMNFHVALRHHGVPTRFIRFPREGHGISEPRHHRTRLVEELRWFERHVRDNDRWQAPERQPVPKTTT